MTQKTENYNLIEEDWIPVLMTNGVFKRVGIRQALTDAHNIRQIAASNPMDRIAILRFLLAILYWCNGSPPDSATTEPGDSLPPDWLKKLDDNRDCFNLLGEGKRFYQRHVVEPCKDENRDHEIIPLIHEIPNGDDKWHFRHSTDKINGLCKACCALGLLRLPVFASGEGRGFHQGINGTPPIYIIPMGRTLFETLILNWTASKDIGKPTWLQPDNQPNLGMNVPLLTGLTLMARRVWLHDPTEEMGICIACSSRGTPIIKTCEYQSCGPLKNEHWEDPHVIYLDKTDRKPRKGMPAADLTKAGDFRKKSSNFKNKSEDIKNRADGFRMDRPWPDLVARIIETGKFMSANKPMELFVVGFATDRAKNVDVWERTIQMPAGSSMPERTHSSIFQWKNEGFKLPRDFHYKSERESCRRHVEIATSVVLIRPQIEGKVSSGIGELLAKGDEGWQQAAGEYLPMMKIISKSLSPGFTSAAVQRRRDIARVAPDMKPITEEDKKPKQ